MQSWSLEKFVAEYDVRQAATIMGISRQAVEQAIRAGRDIRIVHTGDDYSAHEVKLLGHISSKELRIYD